MESKNKQEVKSNSGLPFVIIGVVFLVVVIGGWYLYSSSSKKPVTSGTTNTATNGVPPKPNNTPIVSNMQGAQPPNFKGAQNSSVVLEEFADYQCPTCATMHPVMNEITATYGSRIKFIYRNYPLTQIHRNAYEAAVAAEAAGLQGKFWDMQNLIFQNQRNWQNVEIVRPVFEGYAQTLGLDVEKFKTDVAGLPAKQRVDMDAARARSLNVSSTPTVLVNGLPIPFEQMTIDGMKRIIDAELAKTGGNQQTAPSAPSAPANSANTANTAK
jgi:protein-disulfide isomerase